MSGPGWYTVLVGPAFVRCGVRASNQREAWERFVAERYPDHLNYGRKAPPKKSECKIRAALPVEIAEYEKKRTKRATQEESMFDASAYDQRKVGNPT